MSRGKENGGGGGTKTKKPKTIRLNDNKYGARDVIGFACTSRTCRFRVPAKYGGGGGGHDIGPTRRRVCRGVRYYDALRRAATAARVDAIRSVAGAALSPSGDREGAHTHDAHDDGTTTRALERITRTRTDGHTSRRTPPGRARAHTTQQHHAAAPTAAPPTCDYRSICGTCVYGRQ